jgi:hypothetical protein
MYKTLVSTSSFSWQELKGDPARWRLLGIKRLATTLKFCRSLSQRANEGLIRQTLIVRMCRNRRVRSDRDMIVWVSIANCLMRSVAI